MRVPWQKKTKQNTLNQIQEKKRKKKKTRNKRKATGGTENEWKMYLKLITCWISYMYNVALNIKTLSTQIWIFLKLHIFFITKQPSLNTKPVNELIQSPVLIHVKKNVISKNISIPVNWSHKLVPEGLGNCSFDLLAELCSDISSTKRHLSLTFKKSTRNNCY